MIPSVPPSASRASATTSRAAQLGAEHDGSQRDGPGQRQHERAVAPPPSRGRSGVQAREQRLDRRERRILDHGVGGTQAVHHVVHDCSSIRARASASRPRARCSRTWNVARLQPAARAARSGRQAFPGGQQQRLAVDRLQLRERVAQLWVRRVFDGHRLGRDPRVQRLAPALGPVAVADHVARDGVQPRESVGRHIAPPPPRHQKGLGEDVLGLVGGESPPGVREHRTSVRLIQRNEALTLAGRPRHLQGHRLHAHFCPACSPDLL